MPDTQKPIHPSRFHAPLLLPLLGFASGLACAAPDFAPLFWPGLALTALAAWGFALRSQCQGAWWRSPVAWLPLFFACGMLHATAFHTDRHAAHHLTNLFPFRQETSLTGRLVQKPQVRTDRVQLLLASEAILPSDGGPPRPATGLTRLSIPTPTPLPPLIPGLRYQARAFLSPPRSFQTPGSFDQAGHLATDDILVTGFAASPLLLAPVASPVDQAYVDRYLLERFRQRFGSMLFETLPPRSAGIYQALLIGDYSGIDQAAMEWFKAAGAIHLLAVSGSHLTVVAAMTALLLLQAARLFPPLLLRVPARKLALALTLPALTLYAGLAGWEAPVLRALLMAGVFIGAMLCDRQWSTPNNLAIAALILLILNPLELTNASFQLSFAATAAIVLIMPRLQGWQAHHPATTLRQKGISLILLSLAISLAASLATAPLTLYHFNRLSLAGPVATLLLTPLLCLWSLPLGLLAMASQPLFPPLAATLLKAGAIGIDLSLPLTEAVANLPLASLWLPTPSLPALLAALLLAAMILRAGTLGQGAVRLCLFAALLSGYGWHANRSDTVRVSCLDVGQGSATVVELPDDTVTLIDGGGPASEGFDIGERVIAPFLWKNHIRTIDQVILTHAHADHFNGLPFVIKHFRPKTLWVNDLTSSDPAFRRLLADAAQAGCEVRLASAGTLLAGERTGHGAAIRCVANLAMARMTEAPESGKRPPPPNRLGMVVRLDHGGTGFLFPGDLERTDEERLLSQGRLPLRADALLLPHHGLKSAGGGGFLAAVAPDYLIASTGREEKVAVATPPPESGQRLLITAREGTVFLTSNGKRINASCWRDGHEQALP
ncbi:MAG: DNA internalization-related competence protein ComEC/Rec2 [Thermodesulfobacteriota bacterium]